ncbi:MAG: hypothetical protein KC668_01150 [Myxococcales bacterium]|nr:hypothetical protein [Myxococcales bacterium]
MSTRRIAAPTPTHLARGFALGLGLSAALVGSQPAPHDVLAQPATSAAARSAPRQRQRRFYMLFEAIANDRVAEVRRRLPRREQINDIDTTSGTTPLTWTLIATGPPTAAHMEIARMLLDRGADPNVRDGGGTTAMEAAVAYPWPEMLSLLIERGGDVRVPANVGETTLLYSVCQGNGTDWPGRLEQRLAIARMLVDAGLDPTEMSPWAQSHNLTAVDNCVIYDMPDIARLYVEHGGRPRASLDSRAPQRAALARELVQLADARSGAVRPQPVAPQPVAPQPVAPPSAHP